MSAQVLVTGGLGAATVVGDRHFVQVGTIFIFVYLLVLAKLSTPNSRAYSLHSRDASLTHTGAPVLIVLVMWTWLYVVNIWFATGADYHQAIFRVVSGITLLVFLIAQRNDPLVFSIDQRHHPLAALQYYSASVITLASLLILLPLFPSWFIPCDEVQFKCNRIDAILQGPLESGNLLGLAAAMCAALLVFNLGISRRSLVVMVFLLLVLYATMSRTSFIALGAAVGFFAVDRLLFRKPSFERIPDWLAGTTAVCIAVVPMSIGMYLVFTSDPDAFSARGAVWAYAREALVDFPVTGRGIDTWNLLKSSGFFGWQFEKFTHSEYLLFYFSGGVIGLVLIAGVLYRITYIAIKEQNSLGRGVVVPLTFAICGMIETMWNPLTIDAGSWLFFALISVACVTRTSEREASNDAAGTGSAENLRRATSNSSRLRPGGNGGRDRRVHTLS